MKRFDFEETSPGLQKFPVCFKLILMNDHLGFKHFPLFSGEISFQYFTIQRHHKFIVSIDCMNMRFVMLPAKFILHANYDPVKH